MWLRSSSISLDGYGFKIRKVSRWRSAASNKTILVTRQEFFFTKVTSADQGNLTDIVLLLFWLILVSWIFISSYIATYFLVKKFIFSNVHISVNTIYECLYTFFWLKKGPSIKDVRNCWVMGVIQNAYRGRGKLWKTSEKGEVSG